MAKKRTVSSKSQIQKIPMFEIPNKTLLVIRDWKLEFIWKLEFGIWNLK